MPDETIPAPAATPAGSKPLPIIDFKLSLTWVIGVIGTFAFFLVSMYFDMRQLVKDVAEVQSTSKASSGQLFNLTAEQALIRYRLDKLENAPPAPAPTSITIEGGKRK